MLLNLKFLLTMYVLLFTALSFKSVYISNDSGDIKNKASLRRKSVGR
jgi:hypothetical protein